LQRLIGSTKWPVELQIAYGIILGSSLSSFIWEIDWTPVTPEPFSKVYFPLFTTMAALAFCIDLHVSPKHYPIALTTSFIGAVGSMWGIPLLGVNAGSLLTAFAIAVVSNLYARYVPPYVSLVGLIPGILLLVPGAMGIRAFFTLSLIDPTSGVAITLGVLLIAIQLAVAVVLGNAVVPLRGITGSNSTNYDSRLRVGIHEIDSPQTGIAALFRFRWRTPRSSDTLAAMLRQQHSEEEEEERLRNTPASIKTE